MGSLSSIKTELKEKNIDALLITSIPNITYLTGISLFSNLEREAYLYITPKTAFLITDGRYSEAVKNTPNFKLIEIIPDHSLKDILLELTKKHMIEKLGFEESNLTVQEFIQLKKHLKKRRLTPIKNLITDIRMFKETTELNEIQTACEIGDKTFIHILPYLKIGVTEKEIQSEIEHFIKTHADTISFTPIVAFGPHSSIPHHNSGNSKLKENSIVLLDFGVRNNNYCSDMTRTVFFGKANPEFKKMYSTVLEAQSRSIEFLDTKQNKLKASDIDNAARSYILEQGFPAIPHSVGHGIGIEVHEAPHISPKSKHTLSKGMVFSIEPGIYKPGFGGVRIEDLVQITASGPYVLTKASKDLIEV